MLQYLAQLADDKHGEGPVTKAVAALKHWHILQGLAHPFGAPTIKKLLAGVRKSFAAQATPKQPLLKPLLQHIVTSDLAATTETDLIIWRTVWSAVVIHRNRGGVRGGNPLP